MASLTQSHFGFKSTCMLVGILNMLFASSMFVKGVMKSMAEFNVPANLLTSPHYEDAMSFVFLHMFMIGVLLVAMSILADDPVKQVWVARVLVVVHGVYALFDVRTSDNYFGNALYQGPGSVIPVIIDVVYLLLFLRLSFASTVKKSVPLSAAYEGESR